MFQEGSNVPIPAPLPQMQKSKHGQAAAQRLPAVEDSSDLRLLSVEVLRLPNMLLHAPAHRSPQLVARARSCLSIRVDSDAGLPDDVSRARKVAEQSAALNRRSFSRTGVPPGGFAFNARLKAYPLNTEFFGNARLDPNARPYISTEKFSCALTPLVCYSQ